MKKRNKQFDSVRMMRSIRDALSKQIDGMSFEEQRQFIRQRIRPPASHAARDN